MVSSLIFIKLYFFKKVPKKDKGNIWNFNKTFKGCVGGSVG